MQSTQFSSVLIILIAVIFTCDSQLFTARLCRGGSCGNECDIVCEWGSKWNDLCGFYECAKGPGGHCVENHGDCGDGLQCRCGKCHGCSNTRPERDCYRSTCLEFQNYNWQTI